MITTIPNLKPGTSYKVQFAGRTVDGQQTEWTNTFTMNVPAGTPHAPPTGGTIGYTTGNINIAWTEPTKTEDFDGYVVDVYTPADVFQSRFFVGTQPTFNFTLALNDALNLVPIPNPRFKVYSQNKLGGLSTTPLTINASYPVMSGFAASAAEPVPNGINWKWSAPSTNGDIVEFYEVDVDAGAVAPTFNEIEAKVYGLNYLYVGSPSTQYSILMRANDYFGRVLSASAHTTATSLAASSAADTTPPAGILAANITANTSAQPLGKFNIALDWTYSPAEPIARYIIDWGTATGVYPNTTSVTAQNAVLTLPRASGSVYLRIRPVDLAGNVATTSTEKTVASVAPLTGLPTGFSAAWTTPTLTVSWTAPSTSGGLATDIVGYNVSLTGTAGTRVYFTKDTKFDFTPELNKAAALQTGAIYANTFSSVSVKAVFDTGLESSALGGGSVSNSYAPTVLAPTLAAGVGTMYANWTSVTDAVEYILYAGVTGSPTTSVWRGTALNASFQVTGVLNWVARIRAVNILGTLSSYSADSVAVGALVADVTPPSNPSGITTSTASDPGDPSGGWAILTVDIPAQTSTPDLAGHTIRYSTGSAGPWTYVDVPLNGSYFSGLTQSITIKGLPAGSSQYVQAAAYDKSNNLSGWVNASAPYPRPLSADTTVPATMAAPSYRTSISYITFFWTDVSDTDVTKGRGQYEVQLDTSNAFNTGNLKTNKVTGTVTAFHGLTSGTAYYYRIRAIDATGNVGAWYQPGTAIYTTLEDTTVLSGSNRLKNSSYKDGINTGTTVSGTFYTDHYSYSGATCAIDNTVGRADTSSIKVTTTAVSQQGFIHFTPVDEILPANTPIVVSAWVQAPAGVVLRIGSRFNLPGSSTYLSEQTNTLSAVTGNGSWQRMSFKYISPAQTTRAGLQIVTTSAFPAAGTIFYVEDAQIEVGDTLTPYTPRGDEIMKNAIINEMVLANSIEADRLKANTIITQNLNVGDALGGGLTVNGAGGYIRSYLYVTSGGTEGYRLTNQGLEIKSGAIEAAALVVKDTANLVPQIYAKFDSTAETYPGRVTYLPNTTGKKSIGWYAASPVGTDLDAIQVTPTNGTPSTTNNGFWLGASDTDYNIYVEPNTTYTLSCYIVGMLTAGSFKFSYKEASGLITSQPTANTGGSPSWQRKSWTFTTSGTTTQIIIGVNSLNNPGVDWWLTGFMLSKSGSLTPWRAPGVTTINGGSIRTGSITSSAVKTVNGIDYPAWAINTQGTAALGDVRVRGSIVVGAGDTGPVIFPPASAEDYVANTVYTVPETWSATTLYRHAEPFDDYDGFYYPIAPWSSTKNYYALGTAAAGHVVTYGGQHYLATAYSNNIVPTNTAYWQPIPEPLPTMVKYNDKYYLCIADNNSIVPTNTAYWTELTAPPQPHIVTRNGQYFVSIQTTYNSPPADIVGGYWNVTSPASASVVGVNGLFYRAVATGYNKAVTNTSFWQPITTTGISVWNSATTYTYSASTPTFVSWGSGVYQLLQTNTNQNPTTPTSSYWQKVTDPDGSGTSIQSANYRPGADGWKISSSGSAEFNASVFRGRVEIGKLANQVIVSTPDYAFGGTASDPGVYFTQNSFPTGALYWDDDYNKIVLGVSRPDGSYSLYTEASLTLSPGDKDLNVPTVATLYSDKNIIQTKATGGYGNVNATGEDDLITFGINAGHHISGEDAFTQLSYVWYDKTDGVIQTTENYYARVQRYGFKSTNKIQTDEDLSNSFNTTTATYATSGQPATVGLAFKAPASGRVRLDWSAQMVNNTAGAAVLVSPEVKTGATIGSGTAVTGPTDARCVRMNGTGAAMMGNYVIVGGLTPGSDYNVRLVHRVSSGTGTIDHRRIMVTQVDAAG